MKNKLLLSIFAFGIISSPCFSIDMGIAPVNPLEKNSNTYQQEMTITLHLILRKPVCQKMPLKISI